MHSRSCNNLQLSVEPPPYKYIAGKQGKREHLLSVFPAADGIVYWQKDLKILCHERLCNRFLMLMPGIEGPPWRMVQVVCGICAMELHSYISSLYHSRKASPCDLQSVLSTHPSLAFSGPFQAAVYRQPENLYILALAGTKPGRLESSSVLICIRLQWIKLLPLAALPYSIPENPQAIQLGSHHNRVRTEFAR